MVGVAKVEECGRALWGGEGRGDGGDAEGPGETTSRGAVPGRRRGATVDRAHTAQTGLRGAGEPGCTICSEAVRHEVRRARLWWWWWRRGLVGGGDVVACEAQTQQGAPPRGGNEWQSQQLIVKGFDFFRGVLGWRGTVAELVLENVGPGRDVASRTVRRGRHLWSKAGERCGCRCDRRSVQRRGGGEGARGPGAGKYGIEGDMLCEGGG